MSIKTGVVFSSGFFGFFAHAGFLSGLREAGVSPSGYGGVSSGAIVAAMAATGMTDKEIRDMLYKVKKSDFWDPDPWHVLFKNAFKIFRGYSGYLRGRKFAAMLEKLPVKRVEECRHPLVIATTNLTGKKEEIFSRGDLVKAVWGSGAVPMLFKPVDINGSLHVDGGLVNKAPLRALAERIMPDRIIVHYILSGNLSGRPDSFLKKKMTPWYINSLTINIARQISYRMQCDMVREMGIEVVEVKSRHVTLGPDRLNLGPQIYEQVKKTTSEALLSAGRN
ncbi:MAG: patatin-like phospholipase family protein [Deltaproteobacteria bacterium]|nr:patatin-like phospholipase family protein [Deltaproteobacteria bacterium]